MKTQEEAKKFIFEFKKERKIINGAKNIAIIALLFLATQLTSQLKDANVTFPIFACWAITIICGIVYCIIKATQTDNNQLDETKKFLRGAVNEAVGKLPEKKD